MRALIAPHPIGVMAQCAIIILAFGAAINAWSDARFAYLQVSLPSAAHKMRPTDATALVRSFDFQAQGQLAPPSDAEIDNARKSLVRTPLSAGALRLIGTRAAVDKQSKRAERALEMAERLTRRDAIAQLWLIQQAVEEGDVRKAMAHYHIALTVNPELRTFLYPILIQAIADPEVRRALLPYITPTNDWIVDVLNEATAKGHARDAAALLLSSRQDLGGGRFSNVAISLISRLAEAGELGQAIAIALRANPGVDRRVLLSAEMDEATTNAHLGALAWVLSSSGPVTASGNGADGIDIDVSPFATGTVATRILPLQGGQRYRFTFGAKATPGVLLKWDATCLDGQKAELVWQDGFSPQAEPKIYTAQWMLPGSCSGLRLELNITGPDSQSAGRAAIDRISLMPIGLGA